VLLRSSWLQVALLFLVKDDIPTEPVWTAFFASAAELTLKLEVPSTRPSPPEVFPPVTSKPIDNSTCWRGLIEGQYKHQEYEGTFKTFSVGGNHCGDLTTVVAVTFAVVTP
jgi:hypothetical protein